MDEFLDDVLSEVHSILEQGNFDWHGLPATVTPPGGTAMQTRAIWVEPSTNDTAIYDLSREEEHMEIALKDEVARHAARRTVIEVAEHPGGPVKRFRVDGPGQIESSHTSFTVVEVGR